MSGKQDKRLRKESQIQKKQLRNVVDSVIDRAVLLPLKLRWRIAMKIFMGKGVSKMLIFLWLLFFVLSIAFFSISFYILFWI